MDVDVRALQVQFLVDMERQGWIGWNCFIVASLATTEQGCVRRIGWAAIVFSLVTVDFEGR